MDDLEAREARRAAPLAEVRARVVKGIAEFDEHVQRHEQAEDILPPRVVDQRLDRDQRAADGQRIVSGADELFLFLQIPVVEDHPHRDQVGFRQRVLEKVAARGGDALAQSGGGDVLLRDRLHGREIKGRAAEMRMRFRGLNAEQPRRAADIAQCLERREVELRREGLEVDPRKSGHRTHELLELRQLRVEFFEDAFLSVLHFVLRFAGAQRLGQVVPEFEEPRIEHREDAADVTRALAIEIERTGRGVEVSRGRPVALAIEKFHRHQRIEKIADPTRMQTQLGTEFRARRVALSELREDPEFDGGEQHLGRPEAKGRLENGTGIGCGGRSRHGSIENNRADRMKGDTRQRSDGAAPARSLRFAGVLAASRRNGAGSILRSASSASPRFFLTTPEGV